MAGLVPCAGGNCNNGPAGSASVVDTSIISPDQQFQAGLFCGPVHATQTGSGAGPWSGYPAYESVAEQMLLEYPTPELVAAVSGRQLSEEEMEGAARLFGGWEFNRSRPSDNALIPDDLKTNLLEHSLRSTDEDKRNRAKHAFER